MSILALDVGGTAIKSALFENDGRISMEKETPSQAKCGGHRLMENVKTVIDGYSGYSALGVSMTGQVDSRSGKIVFANGNVPNFTGTPVADILRAHAHVPVAVGNDVNAAALGEAWFGAGRGYPDFLCLTYGTGVGGAIVAGGRIYGGADGVAGEMGHILTHPDGLPCACGQRGCYEQYASMSALLRSAQSSFPQIHNGRELFEKLPEQPELAQIVAAWELEIVYGLVSLVHIFNPSLVVLGGGVMGQKSVLQGIRTLLYPRVMNSYRGVEIAGAQLGNHAGLYGAFTLARQALEEKI